MSAMESSRPVESCSRVCPHALRLRVLMAQFAHLNHKVASVAHGLAGGTLAVPLASRILSRAMHETAVMGGAHHQAPEVAP